MPKINMAVVAHRGRVAYAKLLSSFVFRYFPRPLVSAGLRQGLIMIPMRSHGESCFLPGSRELVTRPPYSAPSTRARLRIPASCGPDRQSISDRDNTPFEFHGAWA